MVGVPDNYIRKTAPSQNKAYTRPADTGRTEGTQRQPTPTSDSYGGTVQPVRSNIPILPLRQAVNGSVVETNGLIPFGENLSFVNGIVNLNDGQNTDLLLEVGRYKVNTQTRELVGKSGFRLSSKQLNQLRIFQDVIEQQLLTGEKNAEIMARIDALEKEQMKIINAAHENSPRQEKLDELIKENKALETLIKSGQQLTTEELSKYVENSVLVNRLKDATGRENDEILKRLSLDYYNTRELTNLNEYKQLSNSPPTPVGRHHIIESGLQIEQKEVLSKIKDLYEKVKSNKGTNEEKEKYFRLVFDLHTKIESKAYDKGFGDENLLGNERLRSRFRASLLVNNFDLSYETIIEYFSRYENSNIFAPKKKAQAGELIELAKKGIVLKSEDKDLDIGEKRQIQFLAAETMKLGDLRDIKGMNLDNEEFASSALTNLETTGSSFRNAKFKNGTILGDSKFSDLSKETNPIDGLPSLDKKYTSDFSGARMRGVNLNSSTGAYCLFRGTDLSGADFLNADFHSADFTRANLSEAVAEGTNFSSAYFENSNLDRLNKSNRETPLLPKTNFSGAVIKNSSASGSNFKTTDFSEAVIDNSELNYSDFSGANLKEVIMSNSRLRGVTFDKDTNFENAILVKNDFLGTKFNESNLTGVNLSNSVLQEAKFIKAKLVEAGLSGVVANNAIFNDSDLTGANLYKAKLINAKFEKATLVGTNLQEAIANNASFEGSDLTGANLLNGEFKSANFKETNLEGVNLQGADLSNIKFDDKTNFSGAIYDDKTILPGVNNNDEKARAAFAKKHGLVHIEQLKLQAYAFNASEAISRIDKVFCKLLSQQGGLSSTVNVLQNSIGKEGGWLLGVGFDSTKGSDHIESKYLQELRGDLIKLRELASSGFTQENKREFERLYTEVFGTQRSNLTLEERLKLLQNPSSEGFRIQAMKDYESLSENSKLRKAIEAIKKDYIENKRTWAESVEMAAGMTAFMAALALAPATGGASLAVAPLVSAGVSVGIEASNGPLEADFNTGNVKTSYTGKEIAYKFGIETAGGYVALPVSMVTGGLAGKAVQKGAGYVLTKVGNQTVARLAISNIGRATGKFVTSTAVHSGSGGGYGFSHGLVGSLLQGQSLETALLNALQASEHGAVMGIFIGHGIGGVKILGQKGLQRYQEKMRVAQETIPLKESNVEIPHEKLPPEITRGNNKGVPQDAVETVQKRQEQLEVLKDELSTLSLLQMRRKQALKGQIRELEESIPRDINNLSPQDRVRLAQSNYDRAIAKIEKVEDILRELEWEAFAESRRNGETKKYREIVGKAKEQESILASENSKARALEEFYKRAKVEIKDAPLRNSPVRTPRDEHILLQQYGGEFIAEYNATRRHKYTTDSRHDSNIDRAASAEADGIFAYKLDGWYWRSVSKFKSKSTYCRDRYSLNVVAHPELVKALDRFILEHGGYYKTSRNGERWSRRHDPVSYFPFKKLTPQEEIKLAQIIEPYVRSKEGLLGQEIIDPASKKYNGIKRQETAHMRELEVLIERANDIDPVLGKAIINDFFQGKKPDINMVTPGQVQAIRNVLARYEAAKTVLRKPPQIDSPQQTPSTSPVISHGDLPLEIRRGNAFRYANGEMRTPHQYGDKTKRSLVVEVDNSLPTGVNARAEVIEKNGGRQTVIRVSREVAEGLKRNEPNVIRILSEEVDHANQRIIDPIVKGKDGRTTRIMSEDEYIAHRAFQEITAESSSSSRFGGSRKGEALRQMKDLMEQGRFSEALSVAQRSGLSIEDLNNYKIDYKGNTSADRERLVQRSASAEGDKYGGRHTIGRDTPIDGGVYLGGHAREAVVVDFQDSPILQAMYKNALAKASSGGKVNPEKFLQSVYDEVKSAMKIQNDDAVHNLVAKYKAGNDKKISLEVFLREGVGVCRHDALACGALIEKAIKDGHISGRVSAERNKVLDSAHAWCRYTDSGETPWILDVRQNRIGKLPDVQRQNNAWSYGRPNERPELERIVNWGRTLQGEGRVAKKNDAPEKTINIPPEDVALIIRDKIQSQELGKLFTVGRSTDCDIKVDDIFISKTQARISKTERKGKIYYLIQDGTDRVPSHNGTYYEVINPNGSREWVKVTSPVVLLEGKKIRFGANDRHIIELPGETKPASPKIELPKPIDPIVEKIPLEPVDISEVTTLLRKLEMRQVYKIGREGDIRIKDPTERLSRKHLRIRKISSDTYIVQDGGAKDKPSMHGTEYRKRGSDRWEKIPTGGGILLKSSDKIRLADRDYFVITLP